MSGETFSGEFAFSQPVINIGSEAGNDIVLVGSTIGAFHAMMHYDSNRWYITPLDSEKTYKLCGVDYMLLSFGDGYAMLKDCPILIKDVVVDNQAVINYLTSLPDGALTEKYGNPYGDGRIVSVAPAQ